VLTGDDLAKQCETYRAEKDDGACADLQGMGWVVLERASNVFFRLLSTILAYLDEDAEEAAYQGLVADNRREMPATGAEFAFGLGDDSVRFEVYGITVLTIRVGTVVVEASVWDGSDQVEEADERRMAEKWPALQLDKIEAALGAAECHYSGMISVVVVDDQEIVRAGFAALLDAQDDIEVVGQAANGKAGLDECARTTPDVVLMDVRMPVLDGVEATRRLAGSPTRVLMLTTFDIDDYVFAALRAGASGFLLKDTTPDDLVAAVRVVAAGESLLAPAVTRKLIAHFVRQPTVASTPPSLDALTPREREVLVWVARGESNAEIAARLVLAEQTVKSHVSRIFLKLGIRDRAQAVMVAYETGLVAPGAF
jgi:DNA-binding NarL/FixJ family response regulator